MNPAARLREALAAELKPKTIMSYVYDAKDFRLPSYLVVPDILLQMHMKVGEAAYAVIKGLLFLHDLRTKRFIAMCPETQGPVFDQHVRSMNRLLEWKEQTDTGDPTLAPAAKIPGAVIGFHLDQLAYDSFTNLYIHSLQRFFAIEWATYSQRMYDIKHAASRQMDHFDYMAWLYWWNSEFKPNMKKWEIYMDDVNLPNWEDTVDELYDMVVERVEDSEDVSAMQLARGLCICKTKQPEGITTLPPDPHGMFTL
ncbi:Peptidyl-prolyl cis-trans isomerase ssp-1 [Penicillium cataractarum]|uniref:Peptidyl-prolyl cis-trans isomerase ssp-1 n=1 Tax=Penicillium cataractarum TaxID=2100454 RepID=A0A9W9RZM5_9EURO|nr:Peptidyl-prolyl cis-trans isomerase ssp-1 [Penicillium cataractarum]KAJ5369002.1 Peptidyl-prolyl cis-trans isomerase ssp-1 [Penicillium cataractarum]